MGKLFTIDQPNNPTQPFILPGSINDPGRMKDKCKSGLRK